MKLLIDFQSPLSNLFLPENLKDLHQILHEESLSVVFDYFPQCIDVSIVEHGRVRIRQQFDRFVHIDGLHFDAW